MKTIALVGNPNSGKTTLFNSLTGSNQYVGNWPGVTVEKIEGRLKAYKDIEIIDLPGIYSLSPCSLEEVITRDYLINESVDVILNIIDATNLERNLYLTLQILEINKPVVVALNLIDIVEKRGIKIDIEKLSEKLGCPVVEISALKNQGLLKLQEVCVELIGKERKAAVLPYSIKTFTAIEKIKNIIDEDNQFVAVKLLDQDSIFVEKYNLQANERYKKVLSQFEKDMNNDSQTILVEERYSIIEKITKEVVDNSNVKKSITEKIDNVVTNRWLAIPIFLVIMFIVYYISIITVGDFATGFMEYLFSDVLGANLATLMGQVGIASWLISLVVDGIIAGVGAVLAFVPQMTILFFFLSFLEDSGYMSRIAFIMDSVFRKFGLSGKSFIPMLIGTGCTVPGIMATRTIENKRDRKMTIILTPFIPCGAKLPVFALFIGIFFGPLASVSMYLLGIIVVIIAGFVLKKFKVFKGEDSSFLLELPDYHLPRPKNLSLNVWKRVKSFIVKAGTIIFAFSIIIWFLQAFTINLTFALSAEESILGLIGKTIAPIFTPLGFGNWQAGVSILTGFVAKENVVATFGIVSGGNAIELVTNIFTPLSGYAFMAFILLSSPCIAAIGATKKELGSWKETIFTVLFQTGVAYLVALLIYQGGRLIANNTIVPTIIVGIVILALFIFAIRRSIKDKGCALDCHTCNKICVDRKKDNVK